MDSVMKEAEGANWTMPLPQNLWARTAPAGYLFIENVERATAPSIRFVLQAVRHASVMFMQIID